MKADVLESSGRKEIAFLGVGLALSLLIHVGLAFGVSNIPARAEDDAVWVEMTVAVTEPPPSPPPPEIVAEPEPEPEPEKPKPKPPPEPVDIKEIPPPVEPPPDQPPPPPEARPVRRMTQGLSASSFSVGAGTGLDARAGTTTAVKAAETMGLDEATEFATVPYTSVATPPKVKGNPPLEVPQEVIDAEVQGRVEVELTISPSGEVTGVTIVSALHPAADAACVAHAKRTRWTPYTVDGVAAAVKGVPFSCRFEKLAD